MPELDVPPSFKRIAKKKEARRVTFHYAEGRIVMRTNCNHDILRRP